MSTAITTESLRDLKRKGEKITSVTAYDAAFAQVLEAAGVEVLLVGDSLGMVLQGHDSTLPVTMDDMVYHAACVSRVARTALRIVDMPFMSYSNTEIAETSAARLMREGGAQMVKLEGGQRVVEIVHRLTRQGIPVCAHLGLTPQSVHQLGGYRVQGRDEAGAHQLLEDARALDQAGASALVLECMPVALARQISAEVSMPTIGIGAGPHCDGQVLVLHDLLGITPRAPRFARDFLQDAGSVLQAVKDYVEAVKDGRFPAPEHCFD